MTEAMPTTEKRTLCRLPNAAYRPREYLTEAEVDRLIEAARKRGRNGPGMLVRSCWPIGTGSALPSFAAFAGRRSIFDRAACM